MKGRNILVCCDGTGNKYGENNTNVVILHSLANEDEEQLAFYDPGVGTGGERASVWVYQENKDSSLMERFFGKMKTVRDKTEDLCNLATGKGIQQNVEDAYRFLMKNYQEGDRLYIFGFSRGAFTVRILAGMLCKVGLLHDHLENLIPYIGALYKTSNNDDLVDGFKKTFSRSCTAHFVGVWDTVKSLHLNAGIQFHDQTLHPDIKFAYHALSIDERRNDFPPYLWDEKTPRNGQIIEQVWFPGVHSDVGGWYNDRGLSNGALNWMAHKAVTHGLRLDLEKLKHNYPADPHDEIHESYEGMWVARGYCERTIEPGAKIHHSVIKRMNNPTNKYKPTDFPKKYTEVTDD